jgi:uncharacterized protein (DUF433 family)
MGATAANAYKFRAPVVEALGVATTAHTKRVEHCRVVRSGLHPIIIRTERGLTISGTRITLYDVMDYVTAQYPSKFIRGFFNLTDEQINAAFVYIETNCAEVEAEYQTVLKESEEFRQYYEEQNRDLIARFAIKLLKPGMESVWEKLQVQKAKH